MLEDSFAEYEEEGKRQHREVFEERILKKAIQILWGEKPDKIHRNAGSLWFDKDGRSYFLMIEECYPD
jgi:hypothetical protein